MTDDLTEFVLAQRQHGVSCAEIGDVIGLDMEQVRTILRVHYAAEKHASRRFNPWRDLRQRLEWNYGDAAERMSQMESDVARWRGLGDAQ